ncbi:hypothetical protein Moror_2423 [Moniliophthora roreri MCA 2997]|uniref:Uncharacterized protein n=1 Tax=Moniliophthora roreri (strain MCA 2997) TaxID=1381753 RepID=V2WZ28_MONRO|nr:hypothetical protein Moror_2423 [Moniliophthora roreri MCA 2997]
MDEEKNLISPQIAEGSIADEGNHFSRKKAIVRHLALLGAFIMIWKVLEASWEHGISCGISGLHSVVDEYATGWIIEDCVDWKNEVESEEQLTHTFWLPVSSGSLSIFADGPWTAVGTFNVMQGMQEKDALVTVMTRRYVPGSLDLCQVRRVHEGHGIQIKTNRNYGLDTEDLHIDVLLPAANPIRELRTNLPGFSHNISGLSEGTRIESVSLASDTSVHVEALSATSAVVQSNIGSITGSFNTTSSLKLITYTGEIDVIVGLINDEQSGDWTGVEMATINGTIKADISMYANSSTSGGKFNVTANSDTGSIVLNTLSAPPSSTVNVAVEGVIEPIDVGLHPTFEGRFNLTTFYFANATVVEGSAGAEDPEGKGRARKIEYAQRSEGLTVGNVWWDDGTGAGEGKERGTVTLVNTLADITLRV